MGKLLTKAVGKVLTKQVGKVLDIYTYSLELRVQDSRGNRFELGLDLDQARTIHSIFSKYVQAQDMIAEVLQPR